MDFNKEEDKALMFYALVILDNEQMDITQNGLNHALYVEDGFVAYDLFDCIRQRSLTSDLGLSSAEEYLESISLLHRIALLSEQEKQASNIRKIINFFAENVPTLEELIQDNRMGGFVGNSDED